MQPSTSDPSAGPRRAQAQGAKLIDAHHAVLAGGELEQAPLSQLTVAELRFR
jgi:hypothetical protein